MEPFSRLVQLCPTQLCFVSEPWKTEAETARTISSPGGKEARVYF